MKLASYSDLHLEFGHDWRIPSNIDADVLILAGDIILFNDFNPLALLLKDWRKPVLFVAGNHEYYRDALDYGSRIFRKWVTNFLPQVHFLDNESITIGGVHFFGGTMWTDFDSGKKEAMRYAAQNMSDFSLISEIDVTPKVFTPQRSVKRHKEFTSGLEKWFASPKKGPRVVITHHAPVVNPKTKYTDSPLAPAFVCTDIQPVIEKFQPDIWIHGHTHECGVHSVGKTRIISNQLGYVLKQGGYECHEEFDKYGCIEACINEAK